MRKYISQAGDLIVSLLIVSAGMGLLFHSLLENGGINLAVALFEQTVCGGGI